MFYCVNDCSWFICFCGEVSAPLHLHSGNILSIHRDKIICLSLLHFSRNWVLTLPFPFYKVGTQHHTDTLRTQPKVTLKQSQHSSSNDLSSGCTFPNHGTIRYCVFRLTLLARYSHNYHFFPVSKVSLYMAYKCHRNFLQSIHRQLVQCLGIQSLQPQVDTPLQLSNSVFLSIKWRYQQQLSLHHCLLSKSVLSIHSSTATLGMNPGHCVNQARALSLSYISASGISA